FCQICQNAQIAVQLPREAKPLPQSRQLAIKFRVRRLNRRPAVQIKWTSKLLRRSGQGKTLTKDRLAFSRLIFLPAKIRRELRRVYVSMILRWYRRLCAHRTFRITSVRSSDSGALC